MQIGVAYYPEQWPEERWATDAQLMRQAGIEVVRVGEFAWSRLEPKRERFETDWLGAAVRVLTKGGLKVIMCTPTAAPPAWLFQRHPDICPMDADGRRWHYGSRRHVCLSSPAYLKYARRIVSEVLKIFGSNPNIVAWQIDNELGCAPGAICYCDECTQAFRRWLKRRYGTTERLNRQWGTSFWSQRYSDWHEVVAPRRTPDGPHPSLLLDYRRFISAQHRAFVQDQRELIRDGIAGEVTVTTNLVPGVEVPHIDLFAFAAAQDVVGLDNYPADASRLELTALGLDLARSAKQKPFWVMEQQAGATLIAGHATQPRPGQLRLWSYQAAAHGAGLISFFRWRTASSGQEMHWYGMLDSDGTPRRRFDELRETIAELKEHAHLWEGCRPAADVAVMLDYDSAWALDSTPLGRRVDYFGHVRVLCRELRRMGAQVDFVKSGQDLSPYRVVVVPMPFLATREGAKQLEVYVNTGGRALVTAPAGYKTPVNASSPTPPPGELTALLGVEVTEHDLVRPAASSAVVLRDGGGRFATSGLCGVLELRGAEALASYESDFYAGSPAVTVRRDGEGEAYYVAALASPELYRAVLSRALEGAGVQLCEWACETIEVVPLQEASGEGRLLFVLNHGSQTVMLPLPQGVEAQELLTGAACKGNLGLGAYGVALLKM